MTPLEQAVEAMRMAVPSCGCDACERRTLLAALDVLMPQAMEMTRETNPRIAEQFPETPRYPDWPSLRDAITQETREPPR